MPFLDAPPIPAKYESGIEITSAHGQETTKNKSARFIQVVQFPVISEGITASKTASPTTTGV